ncbi:MAG: DUF4270 domain-containing protein [Muribaculaceae bacterium]
MKKTFNLLLLCVVLSWGMISCNDNTTGSSISQSIIEIVMDSTFTVSGTSIENNKIESRTLTQLLGIINAEGFGELHSDIVTQFMPAFNLDTVGVTAASVDSMKLVFTIPKGGFTGDSIVPMRLNVYQLTKQLPSKITSEFDPAGYYNKNNIFASTVYSASAIGLKDSLLNLKDREVKITIPKEFGVALFNQYKTHPETFATPQAFAKYFPGVYVTTSYGSGRVMNIGNTVMNMYYRKTVKMTDKDKDTTYLRTGKYLAVTPEVITNNNIKLNVSSSVKQLVAQKEAIIQAPAGYDVTMKFPVQDIINKFNLEANNIAIVNNLYFEVPASLITNKYGIKPPQYLLLVKSNEKDEFFAKNKITDNKSSFYAIYNASKKAYIFSDMKSYMVDIIKNKKGIATEDDINLTLTPVTITTEKQSASSSVETITSIVPYISAPTIVKLDFAKAKIRLTYSKQVLNN